MRRVGSRVALGILAAWPVVGCEAAPSTSATAHDASTPDLPDSAHAPEDAAASEEADAASPAAGLRLWAPHADAVAVVGSFTGEAPMPLARTADGHWERAEPVPEGALYRFVIRHDGRTLERLDPRALGFDEASGRSRAVTLEPASDDERAFVRPALEQTVIYELHAGTFASGFEAMDARMDHLSHLGVNAIELMPVHEFPGARSWGYNPNLLFAVENAYGGAKALRQLIREAHARGIAVLLDVVYNHLNDDNPLCDFDGFTEAGSGACGGVYFYDDARAETDWGPRPDFRQAEVRAYLRDNVEMWLRDFRFDGLRFDSTSNIWNTRHGEGTDLPEGATLLRELNDTLHAQGDRMLSIAEDLHAGALATRATSSGGYGFDSQWDAGFHVRVRDLLTRAADAVPDVQAIVSAVGDRLGAGAFSRVIYSESHDTTGKLNGHVRLPNEIAPEAPEGDLARRRALLAASIMLTSPGVPMLLQGQELLQTGSFHDDEPVDWSRVDSQADTLSAYRTLIALRRNRAGHSAGLLGEHTRFLHVNQAGGVLGYVRGQGEGEVLVLLNLGAKSFASYRIGAPRAGAWTVRFDGRSAGNLTGQTFATEPRAYDGQAQSLELSLPPESALVLSR